MKKYIYLVLLALVNVMATHVARATHIAAAEITYAYTGTPNTWLLTMKAYRDCSPGTANLGTTAAVCYSSAALNFSSTVTLQLVPGSGNNLPPSPCLPVTGQGQCYQEFIYQGLVTLPGSAPDWIFSWTNCCRNGAICNIQTPLNQGVIIRSGLNSTIAPTNSSPVFFFIPINRFCVNNQFIYSMGATDVDGDSLHFFLTDCEDYNQTCTPGITGTPIPWQAPATATQPFPTANGITIDPGTGIMQFQPTQCCVYNICVQVDEYRNGVKIGFIRRDLQVNVVCNCTATPPQFTNLIPLPNSMQGILANCGDTVVRVYFTQKMQCGSVNVLDLRVTEASGFPNPVTNIVPLGCVNGLSDTMDVYLFNKLKAGLNWIYTKIGNDGNTLITECGIEMMEHDSIPIWVVENLNNIPPVINIPTCDFNSFTVIFSQDMDCNTFAPNLSDFILVDATGTPVPITSITSNCQFGNPWSYENTFTFWITPGPYASPLTLTVKNGTDGNTLASYCGSLLGVNDTIATVNFGAVIPMTIGPDVTICEYEAIPLLDAGVTGSFYTYQWYMNFTSISGATSQTYQPTQPGQYSVIVSVSPTCMGGDTMSLTINPAPVINIGPDTTVCIMAGYTLNAQNGGSTYQWFLNGMQLAGETQQTYTPTQTGNYSVAVTTGDNCSDTASVYITITNQAAQPTPQDATYCEGEPIPVLDAGITNVGYWWLNSNLDTLATTQVFQPTAPGTYTVWVHINGDCKNSNSATITEYPTPQVEFTSTYAVDPIHNGIHICDEEDLQLAVTSNPNGSSYIWTYTPVGGGPLDLNNNTPSYNVPQHAYGSYEIEVTDVNGCRNTIEIEVEEQCELIFHNVITPNGDGNNDGWVIENFDASVTHDLHIYNRWGNEVYSTSNFDNFWRGVDNSGKELTHGVYYYVLNYNGQAYSGNITKIRKDSK